jgi:hypothetical protein
VCLGCLREGIEKGISNAKVVLNCQVDKKCSGTYAEPFIQRALEGYDDLSERLDALRANDVMRQLISAGLN